MQALRAAKRCRHRLNRGADDVVIGVLLLQRHARSLAMGPQHFGAFRLSAQPIHRAIPQHARGAQLCDLHKEVHADPEKERQTARKGINIKPRIAGPRHIFLTIGNGEGEFLHRCRTSFMHVIAAY